MHGPFARIPQTLATFRVHPQSASVSDRGAQMAEEHIRLVNHVYAAPGLPPEARRSGARPSPGPTTRLPGDQRQGAGPGGAVHYYVEGSSLTIR